MSLFGRYARLTRTQYFVFHLSVAILGWALVFRALPFAASMGWTLPRPPALPGPEGQALAVALVAAPLLLWSLVVGSRLRDMGVSAWFALILPFGGGVATWLGAPPLAVLGVSALMVLPTFFWPGTIGPGRYGPDPRGWLSREHFDTQQAELAALMQN
jgi:uncharacterized membrane protein YhaH (DUF805 family)